MLRIEVEWGIVDWAHLDDRRYFPAVVGEHHNADVVVAVHDSGTATRGKLRKSQVASAYPAPPRHPSCEVVVRLVVDAGAQRVLGAVELRSGGAPSQCEVAAVCRTGGARRTVVLDDHVTPRFAEVGAAEAIG